LLAGGAKGRDEREENGVDLRLSDEVRPEADRRGRRELDVESAPQLDEHLTSAILDAPALLVVDLSDVDFLDSTGLGVLIKAYSRQRDLDSGFAIVASADRITKVFRITGMDTALSVHPDLESALVG
jgi:anti-sigma B factor antagonist